MYFWFVLDLPTLPIRRRVAGVHWQKLKRRALGDAGGRAVGFCVGSLWAARIYYALANLRDARNLPGRRRVVCAHGL